MTALTETGLVNLALREISDYRIEDIDESSAPAIIARDVIDNARRMALSVHEWKFALKFAELAQSATAPIARYDYAWVLPADFVRLGAVADNESMEPAFEQFMISEGNLLTSSDYVFIEYVYDAPAIGAWPPYFVSYLAAMLAAEMAGPLKSTTERERLEGLAKSRLGHARSLDSVQGPVLTLPQSKWLSAMRGTRQL